jgi:aspartyl-tRNA(Asn)/glutamyl-tRNA(Gln) amidotransferase subunit A
MILTYAEAASCHANKQGITFGPKSDKPYEEMLIENRSNNFGEQLKRRFVIGAYVTSSENFENIYQRTKKIRTLLNNMTNKILSTSDALLLPSASSFSPSISAVEKGTFKTTLADDCLQLANFSGCPSLTIPYTVGKDSWGVNITTKRLDDQNLLNMGLALENLFEKKVK